MLMELRPAVNSFPEGPFPGFEVDSVFGGLIVNKHEGGQDFFVPQKYFRELAHTK